ncbi:MAG: diguanylate cyclase [Spirochaetales bacterium]|nr:diguanylate cyclase [Spirochaetales bacterium]
MEQGHTQSYHILVADHDPAALAEYEKEIAELGFIVSKAFSGQAVISLFEAEPVEILLLDLGLERPEALELLKIVRKKTYDQALQVVFLSSVQRGLDQAVELGADDILKKPVDPEELRIRLKAAVIRLREQQKLLREKEFFRQAVKQEEAFSSRILEQHLNLKKAFHDIELINEELERSNRRLERVAKYDMLSGLLNRMSLFSLIDVEVDRSVRTATPLSGVMFDIDYFKEINDNYGHQHGDETIRTLGAYLLNAMRKYDNAGRYGGEEFFILLPNTNLEQGVVIAERFRMGVEKMPVECMDSVITVTASFGVAEFHEGESREAWINRADKAMYRAKQEGRNRVRYD